LNYTNASALEPEETISRHINIEQPLQNGGTGSTLKTILLVEDSEPAIIQVKDFLEEGGYHILVAHDGAEALKIISTYIPDAIILDLMMPDIDGFELLKTLRDAEPTALVPVLILTAKHITKDELSFIKRNNIHQLIQKGDVNRNELLHSIATMVNQNKEKSKAKETNTHKAIGKPVVLVVEDNIDNMVTVKALLADGFTVLEAMDGERGIIMALEHCPDLILMDIELPGIDGIQAFKSIRKDGHLQHIPIIALTASALTSDRETILAYGFDAYVSKPIEVNMFLKVINETLYGK
jgi:CheY-like chemotaxis protein